MELLIALFKKWSEAFKDKNPYNSLMYARYNKVIFPNSIFERYLTIRFLRKFKLQRIELKILLTDVLESEKESQDFDAVVISWVGK